MSRKPFGTHRTFSPGECDLQPSQAGSPRKRPYQKPGFEIVELTVEQVLGAGCKTGTSGAAPTNCYGCNVLGS